MTEPELIALELAGLQADCAAAGLPFDLAWLPRLAALCHLVAQEARHQNLVGDPSPAGVRTHIAEALTTAAVVAGAGVTPRVVADIGAGAGLEALVLALAWPTATITAIEPRRLRAEFIVAAVAALGLPNVEFVRATLHGAVPHRLWPKGLDVATARAVWPAPEWMVKAAPLLAEQGVAIVHGRGPAEALGAQLVLLGAVAAVADVPGPHGHAVAAVRLGPAVAHAQRIPARGQPAGA